MDRWCSCEMMAPKWGCLFQLKTCCLKPSPLGCTTQAPRRQEGVRRDEMSRGCAKAERHRDGEAIGEMTEMQRNKSKVENRNDTDYDSKTKQNSKLRHKHWSKHHQTLGSWCFYCCFFRLFRKAYRKNNLFGLQVQEVRKQNPNRLWTEPDPRKGKCQDSKKNHLNTIKVMRWESQREQRLHRETQNQDTKKQ